MFWFSRHLKKLDPARKEVLDNLVEVGDVEELRKALKSPDLRRYDLREYRLVLALSEIDAELGTRPQGQYTK